jgi:hypothetical protein
MAHRLPSVGYLVGNLAGKVAAPRAAAGADVLPWRPCTGVYLMFEDGYASPEDLIDVPGVAGAWWYRGTRGAPGFGDASEGKQMTYLYLDEDPVEVAVALGERMKRRWSSGMVKGLLAAPFHAIVPFDWGRHLP